MPSGAIYGFLGPNGAGKTTTIRLLLAQLRPAAGTISVLGEPMPANVAKVLARTGFVPEALHLYPSLSVGEALRYHSAFYPTWDQRRAGEMAAAFRLDSDQRISRLSKGERGQLMILLALAQEPELLVLDEPTEGLDPVVRRDILAALLEYVSARGATVFISSHLVHELEGFCDWVGVMDDGRLLVEMRMQAFKGGLKKLRVSNPPAAAEGAPFVLLSREGDGVSDSESWLVQNWEPAMTDYFSGTGANLREVIDLDLEEAFVELLRSYRTAHV